MTTRTTNHLPRITRANRVLLWLRWHRRELLTIAPTVAIMAIVAVLLRPQSVPQVRAVPTPALPITSVPMYIIATAQPPAPTSTPDTRVLDELAALRQQVADLQAAQRDQPVPQVVYQVSTAPEPVAPAVDAVPTPAPQPEPAPVTIQAMSVLDRNAWAQTAEQQRAATEAEWARQQWQAEHCIGGICTP